MDQRDEPRNKNDLKRLEAKIAKDERELKLEERRRQQKRTKETLEPSDPTPKSERINVDEIIASNIFYLKNGLDPNDLEEYNQKFMDMWVPNWRDRVHEWRQRAKFN